ncbi:hypothetical protein Vafri_17648, partial [Volvox africanus]
MDILDDHDEDFLKGLPPLAEWCPNHHNGARQKLPVAATMPRSTFLSGSAQIIPDMYGNLGPWTLSVPPALERASSRPAANCMVEAVQLPSFPPVCSVGWTPFAPSLPAGQHAPNPGFAPEQWAPQPQAQPPPSQQFHPSWGADGPVAATGSLPWPWGQDIEPYPEQASQGHVVTTGLVHGGPGPWVNSAVMLPPRPAITGSIQQRMQPPQGSYQPPQHQPRHQAALPSQQDPHELPLQPRQRPQPQCLQQQQQQEQQQARLPHQQEQVRPQQNPSPQQGPPAQYPHPQQHPNPQHGPPVRQQQHHHQQQPQSSAQHFSQLPQHLPPRHHYPNAQLCLTGQRQSAQQCSLPQECPQQYMRQCSDTGYGHPYSQQCPHACQHIHVQECPQQYQEQQQQHMAPQQQEQQQWHGYPEGLSTCLVSGQVIPEEELLMAEILAAPWPSSKMSYDAATAAYAAAAALANTQLVPGLPQPVPACGVVASSAPEPTADCMPFSVYGSYGGGVATAGETMVASSAPATPMLSPPSPPEHCTACRRLQAPAMMPGERPRGEADPAPLPAASSLPCPVRSMPQAREPQLAPAGAHSGPATFGQPLSLNDPRVSAQQPHHQGIPPSVDFHSQLRDEGLRAAARAVVMPNDVAVTAAVGVNHSSGMGAAILVTAASAAAAAAVEGPSEGHGGSVVRCEDAVHQMPTRASCQHYAGGGAISSKRNVDDRTHPAAAAVKAAEGLSANCPASAAATVAATTTAITTANGNANAANAAAIESHRSCGHRAAATAAAAAAAA